MIKLIDFGMLVLIWMVQLIVYPGFSYYSTENLIKWHGPYTTAITFIVMPLMLGQLLLHGNRTFQNFSVIHLITFLLVVATWGVTFAVSVPLHNKIGLTGSQEAVQKLIATNWIRTVLWSLIFGLSYLGEFFDSSGQ